MTFYCQGCGCRLNQCICDDEEGQGLWEKEFDRRKDDREAEEDEE